jgi:hypothetical protein
MEKKKWLRNKGGRKLDELLEDWIKPSRDRSMTP